MRIEIENYTESQWEEDMRLNKFCSKHPNWFYSGCTIPCPNCQSLGFYGPKVTVNETTGEIIRRYRGCKFCGFWQDVGKGKSYWCIALYCSSCDSYDWTAPKEEQDYKSCKCRAQYKKINWASDDPNHVFHKLKEMMDKIHGLNLTSPIDS